MAEEKFSVVNVVSEFKVENYPEVGDVTYFATWNDGKTTAQIENLKTGTTSPVSLQEAFGDKAPKVDMEKMAITTVGGRVRQGGPSGSSRPAMPHSLSYHANQSR